LTAQGLEEGTHFRPWHDCHGRSIFYDHLDEELPRDLVALSGRRQAPGARQVFEEPNQESSYGLIRVPLIFRECDKYRCDFGFLVAILMLANVPFKVQPLQALELSRQPQALSDQVDGTTLRVTPCCEEAIAIACGNDKRSQQFSDLVLDDLREEGRLGALAALSPSYTLHASFSARATVGPHAGTTGARCHAGEGPR
jgi:hypothetical protein